MRICDGDSDGRIGEKEKKKKIGRRGEREEKGAHELSE